MVDVLQVLQQFLCYGGNQGCIQEFQSYAFKPPMEGLFYLVVFPIVFIIVFIYLLAHKLFPTHRGLNILISVAFFAFIILQGLYQWFMMLGKIWYIALIILGFFWLALYGLRGGIGGPGGGQGRAFGMGGGGGGLTGRIMGRVIKKATGAEKATLDLIETQLALFKTLQPGNRDIGKVSYDISTALSQYWQEIQLGGGIPDPTSLHKYKKLIAEYKRLAREKKAAVPEGVETIVQGLKKY